MDISWSSNTIHVLQEIDWKMSRIESILQHISERSVEEVTYEIHQNILEVSQLLLTLQKDPKMTPLAKGLRIQLQSLQEQCNQIFDVE